MKFAGEINQFLRINFKSFVSAFLGIPVSHVFFLISHGFGFACKCVYVIKCIKCDVFYIGETGTPCMNSHLTEIHSGTSIVVPFPLTTPNFIWTSRRPLPRRAIRGDNSDQQSLLYTVSSVNVHKTQKFKIYILYSQQISRS